MGKRLLPYVILVSLLLVTVRSVTTAQSLALLGIDPGAFPVVTGSVLLYDAAGLPILPLTLDQLQLSEEGIPRTITRVSCPDPTDPEPLSVVVVIDRSGSMEAPLPNNLRPIDMVVTGVDRFLETLSFAAPTAVALTAFNERTFLLSDFRTTPGPLRNALQGLSAEGGTIYDPAFLEPLSGAIDLLKKRSDTVRRVILFITDGEPEATPNTDEIIIGARNAGIEVWAVTVGGKMTAELRTIVERTGGEAWGEVTDPDRLSGILRRVALLSRGLSPCTITWRSDTDCGPGPVFRNVRLRETTRNLGAEDRYRIPERDLVRLETSTRLLYFGKAQFPNVSQLSVTITARNGDFTVTGARFSDSTHFRVERWGQSNPPFTLAEGESRTIEIRFMPRDSTTYAGTLTFDGTPCNSRDVLLAGGERNPEAPREPLVLRSPLGGESFSSCDSVTIRWGGVDPDRAVRIQYSRADGRGWQTISDSATGFEHRWLPPEPDSTYRIRISTDAAVQHLVSTVAGGGQFNEDSIFATDAALAFPMGLDTRGGYLYIAENGSHRVRQLDLETGIITTLAGTGISGNGGDGSVGRFARLNSPTDVSVASDTIFITEYPRVRAIDTGTGIIESWAGNVFHDYSPDGTHMANLGSLMTPFSVVADSRYIYLSELDSHRIRKIDRTTRIISTVAGGGRTGGFDSDGRPATEAYLLLPRGLALRDSLLYVAEETGHRVRVINLNTGRIWTVAGNGSIGDGGDGGLARNATLNGPVDLEFWGDTLLIADRYANRIRMVNLRTGIISGFAGVGGIDGFSGDSGAARFARFASPSGLARHGDLLFVADRLNNRVRQITLYRADGLDSSRSSFRVVGPAGSPKAGLVDFGSLPVDQRKDSILTAFFCNTGTIPMRIDSARILGNQRGEFFLTGGVTDVAIAPGECRTLSVAFRPGATGQRRAELLIYGSCSPPDTVALIGQATPSCRLVSIDRIDVEPVILGVAGQQSRDTTLRDILCNEGDRTISGTLRLVSPDGAWELLGSRDFSLAPGDCLEVAVRFAPDETGSSMALLEYETAGGCEATTTILGGRALHPGRLTGDSIDLGSFICPEQVDTVIRVNNLGDLPVSLVDITLPLNDEGFSLGGPLPDPTSPLVVGAEQSVAIPVRFRPGGAGAKRAIVRLVSDDGTTYEIRLSASVDSIRIVPIESLVTISRNDGGTFPRDTVIRFVNTGDAPATLSGLGLSGGDVANFAIPSGIFPLVIPPGDTVEVPVRFLQPTEDRSYRTTARGTTPHPCVGALPTTELVITGSDPLLRAASLRFDPVSCDDVAPRDTTLQLHNDGGGVLEIDLIEILDDPSGRLEVLATPPLSIPSGESITIPVRFTPGSGDDLAARLRLTTNTPDSPEEITIAARRDRVTFTLSPTSLRFSQSTREATITLMNSGDLPITWDLSGITGPFEIVSITPQTAAAGAGSEAIIRYVGTGGAADNGLLTVLETICGQSAVVRLEIDGLPAIVELSLPVDSVMANEEVSLPVRFRAVAGTTPADDDSVEVEVSFIGTTFFFESLSRGEVIGREWDRASETTTLRIAARFGDRQGDTLFSLQGRGLQARFPATPLRFGPVVWGRLEVATETVDGLLSILGLCLDDGLHLSVRPPVLRSVLPHPVRSRATLRLDLPDWTSMRIRIVDGRGIGKEIYRTEYLSAGEHAIEVDLGSLEAGFYGIVIDTPHGRAGGRLIVLPE